MPETGFQLAMLVILVLPGTVYQVIRAACAGPRPDDASATNRVLRALGISALLDGLYLLAVGPQLVSHIRSAADAATSDQSIRPLAIYAVALLFAVPAGLAFITTMVLPKIPLWVKLRHTVSRYDPIPTAWDWAFDGAEESFIRIQMNDGTYFGGRYGGRSFSSSYPEAHDIFLEEAWPVSKSGEFGREPVKGSCGIWIRGDDVRAVEFIAPMAESAKE